MDVRSEQVLETIQMLWVGPRLSTMERLAMHSFLAVGNETHLYTYGEVEGVPDGVVVRDGNEILPESAIFFYRDRRSYAGFSNFFRYKLLLERGGCWADTDMIALRPLDFADEYVFSSEDVPPSGVEINCGFIKAPRGSEVMRYAWETCKAKDPNTIKFGETGPYLAAEAVEKHGLQRFVRSPDVFCSIGYQDWEALLAPTAPLLPETALTLHLWNEMWRLGERDKDASYDPASLYEQLKRRFLPEAEAK